MYLLLLRFTKPSVDSKAAKFVMVFPREAMGMVESVYGNPGYTSASAHPGRRLTGP